jgi:uncharacterized protein YidB (DUF937 family)
MGLLDSLLGGNLNQLEANALPALISAALAKTNLGNLQGLVNQLQAGGLGPQVQSWLGNGANLPVSPDQLRAALGSEQVRQMAQHFGVDPDAALKLLAEHLPGAVDQASPTARYNRPDVPPSVCPTLSVIARAGGRPSIRGRFDLEPRPVFTGYPPSRA